MNRLKALYLIQGQLITVSGLHIGRGKDSIEIGSVDAPVMKQEGQPFIPGSSLKGKLRSLLEWYLGVVKPDRHGQGKPFDGGENPTHHPIARIFGTTHDHYRGGPTRLIVRDALLDSQWYQDLVEVGLAVTEEKAETAIDRIQGSALTGTLRHLERVVPGSEFKVELLYRVYDLGDLGSEDEKNFHDYIPVALKLLEMDGLGGGGSRGSGQIRFANLTLQTITYLHEAGAIREQIGSPQEFKLTVVA